MTQYAEGCLVGQVLQDMLVDYAADNRFNREMVDDVELLRGGETGWMNKSHQNRSTEE